MATTVLQAAPGYKTDEYASDTYKILTLAEMLAGYDKQTWKKLKRNRKLTYIRAASNLLYGLESFQKQLKEWGDLK